MKSLREGLDELSDFINVGSKKLHYQKPMIRTGLINGKNTLSRFELTIQLLLNLSGRSLPTSDRMIW